MLSKTSSTQRQISQETEADLREIIALDSDDDDDDVQLLPAPAAAGTTSLFSASAATVPHQHQHNTTSHHHQSDKGERIVLKIRSNGVRTDDVSIHMVPSECKVLAPSDVAALDAR